MEWRDRRSDGSRDAIVDALLEEQASHGRTLVPPFLANRTYATDRIFFHRDPVHTLTATIRLNKFLGQSRLDLEVTVALDES